jgi:hypothetical protein
VARTTRFSQVLWSLTLAWLASCGRIGFDLFGDDGVVLPDAPMQDAPMQGAPLDAAPNGPVMAVTVPAMTTECGNSPSPYQLKIGNSGDQPLVISKLTSKANVIVTVLSTVTPTMVTPSFEVQTAPLPLTIPPGTSTMLIVIPPVATVGTDVGGTMMTGSFTVETDTGATSDVGLAATVVGANVAITVPATTNLTLRSSNGTCPSQMVTIAYSGNAAVQIDLQASSGLGFQGFTSGILDVIQSKNTQVRPISNQCAASGMTMEYQVTGVVCQKPAILNVSYQITGASTCSCS